MLALVHLHAQSKLDAVGDVQPVEGLTAKLEHDTANDICDRQHR